jgi:hypothetical protein
MSNMYGQNFEAWLHRVAVLLVIGAFSSAPLRSAAETELKDDTGKTIIRYVVEAPDNISPAGAHRPETAGGIDSLLSGARPAHRRRNPTRA